ncbi:MAG: hypothetical protein M0Z36_11880 [Thermaerobacter sp.]|nr:hypothetical protein [Thermaerobacter sp.]
MDPFTKLETAQRRRSAAERVISPMGTTALGIVAPVGLICWLIGWSAGWHVAGLLCMLTATAVWFAGLVAKHYATVEKALPFVDGIGEGTVTSTSMVLDIPADDDSGPW